jgi:hypothetical protein
VDAGRGDGLVSRSAVLVGLTFGAGANLDLFHRVLRWFRMTRKTSFPSEWCSTFNRHKRYIILTLKDQRRVYGYPVEFPDQGDQGHFVLCDAEWLLETGDPIKLATVELLMIAADQVEFIELMKTEEEIKKLELKNAERQGKDGKSAATQQIHPPHAALDGPGPQRAASANGQTKSLPAPSQKGKVNKNCNGR